MALPREFAGDAGASAGQRCVPPRLGNHARPQARQLVRHNHILVNGKKVNIPSYLVSANDVITVKPKTAELDHFKNLRETGAAAHPQVAQPTPPS